MKTLVIDDDQNISQAIKSRLSSHGFIAETALTGKEGVRMARLNHYDVLIVDLNLPDISGEQVVAEVRSSSDAPPILMASVVSDVDAKVRLLESGADDYLTKPFAFEELLARMRALTRRPTMSVPSKLKIGSLEIDTTSYEVRRGKRDISLTRKEFDILERLIRHKGSVVSKGQLIEEIWDSTADPFSMSFDTHLANLRKKLGKPELIHTVHGRGYRIE